MISKVCIYKKSPKLRSLYLIWLMLLLLLLLSGLLFHFLDELLFLFSAEPFLVCAKLEVSKFDLVDFEIDCLCYGEPFQLGKHPQGTEVKAITYSAMQVIQKPTKNEVYVIIDIWSDHTTKSL